MTTCFSRPLFKKKESPSPRRFQRFFFEPSWTGISHELPFQQFIAGIHSEVDTALVLSGATKEEDLVRYAYRPTFILKGVGDVIQPLREFG